MGLNPVQLGRIAFSFYATTSMAVTRVVFLFFVFFVLYYKKSRVEMTMLSRIPQTQILSKIQVKNIVK